MASDWRRLSSIIGARTRPSTMRRLEVELAQDIAEHAGPEHDPDVHDAAVDRVDTGGRLTGGLFRRILCLSSDSPGVRPGAGDRSSKEGPGMLARDENERVSRVGRGTPMGDTMRRYWIPALLAWELPEPDCPPVRVKLLGEELVAFRDTRGRIGLLEERCPHRQASLFFGRNEECGLRCVYHGWKFDVDGRCLDMMNEPDELDLTDYGYRYAGLRPLEGGDVHVRAYHFILPFHQIRPGRTGPGHGFAAVAGHTWVPIDDETTMVYNWEYSTTEPLTEEDRLERRLGNGPLDVDQTTFRSRRNRENNYLQDRRVQKTETFTGIDGINAQDRAIQESMGRIIDRTREHLGPADKAIIQARRLLLQAIRTVEAGGTPPGVEPTYYTLRPAEAVVSGDTDWRTLLAPDAPRTQMLQQASSLGRRCSPPPPAPLCPPQP